MENSILTLKSTKLNLDIKRGEVKAKETNKYTTASEDEITETFNMSCNIDSENLGEWLDSVVESWVNGKSIRAEATVNDNE